MTSIDIARTLDNLVPNEAKSRHGRDPLPRLLAQLTDRAGGLVTVERATSRPWASALFQGRRHVVMLHLTGPDASGRRTRFATGLEEAEWTLPGHFVADITIDDQRSCPKGEWIELSALTIEEW